jgi:predicted pyridoxine 5'-phosphate oxidase superfamily flavin-nucleotide-binding protein
MKIKDIKKIIEENAIALSTVNQNGNPHVIAVGDVKVIENKLIIGDIFIKETLGNIKKNPNVSLAVWTRNWEENCKGYELRGVAEYFKQGKWLEKAKKIHSGFKVKGAIIINIKKIKKLA